MYPPRRLRDGRKRCPRLHTQKKADGISGIWQKYTHKLKVREGSIKVGKGRKLLKYLQTSILQKLGLIN